MHFAFGIEYDTYEELLLLLFIRLEALKSFVILNFDRW